ncbi:MAG: serine/threonine-protein kinase [Gemmatimonadetes bacterium]|nr:serine/threonine-protein kinase [Gemmatimonadota bacterium]
MEPLDRLNAALDGRYRIVRQVGAGGMATVYLADDVRHARRVALKVLKPELAAVVGADRFLSEITTTANLQHPHILPLYDSGEADSFLFYVMPYVEGESLRQRLDREHQLPVGGAVPMAVNVAEALDFAHRQGVVHRDIKPANILLLDDKPVVSDFGIALAVGAAAGGDRLTDTGLSLGTPHYMSPEQATGDQAVGAASDVYSLACVLYEMLVGVPPYTGRTAQAILAQILTEPITPPARQRPATPPNVDAAIRKALEKVPADRFITARDFAGALTAPGFRYQDSHATDTIETKGGTGLWKGVAAATTVAAIAAIAFAVTSPSSGPPSGAVVERFASPFDPSEAPRFGEAGTFALAPDGSFLVYRGPPDPSGTTQLWVRQWSELSARRLLPQGQERAGGPSVSRDGSEVAASVGPNECVDGSALSSALAATATDSEPCRIVVMPLSGSGTRELSRGTSPYWASDGHVYYSTSSGTERVPEAGGVTETVTSLGAGETAHVVSDLVEPSGELLIYAGLAGGDPEIRAVDPETGLAKAITRGFSPRFAAPDHLLFVTPDLTLTAARFDPRRMEITGPEVTLVRDVSAFSIADDGRLFYSTGFGGSRFEFAWIDRFGRMEPVDQGWAFNPGTGNRGWSLSPDGTRIAVREISNAGLDIWIKELNGGPHRRLTLDPAADWAPRWATNDIVTFLSERSGDRDVFSRSADGTGDARLVWDDERRISEAQLSPDARWIVARSGQASAAAGTRDIYAIDLVDSMATPILAEPFDEATPNLSPDGRWLAYISNEGGRYEVFVRPFPSVNDDKVQVSVDGGWMPTWANSGAELFYVNEQRDLVAASIDTSNGFRVLERQRLFTLPEGSPRPATAVLIWPDTEDDRFLVARPVEEAGWSFVLVNNFSAELQRRVN